MKKMVALFVVLAFVGCNKTTITGQFFGNKGETLGVREIKDNDQIVSPGGAILKIKGWGSQPEVSIEPLSKTKIFTELAVISTVGVAVTATAVSLIAGDAFVENEFSVPIPPLSQDMKISLKGADRKIEFVLLKGPDVSPEGEALEGLSPEGQTLEGQRPEGQVPEGQKPEGEKPEGQPVEGQTIEGEIVEGQPVEGEVNNDIAFTVDSPSPGAVFNSGDTVNLVVNVTKPKGTKVDVLCLSPDQERKPTAGVTPPIVVSNTFVLTARGTGNFLVTVKNGDKSLIKSIPVFVE